jgi:hypothetical protein
VYMLKSIEFGSSDEALYCQGFSDGGYGHRRPRFKAHLEYNNRFEVNFFKLARLIRSKLITPKARDKFPKSEVFRNDTSPNIVETTKTNL